MNDITPKEAIANLNRLYGMVAPDIQRSIDVAIKALERPQVTVFAENADETAIEDMKAELHNVLVSERPQGEWISQFDYCKQHNMMPSGYGNFWWCNKCDSANEKKSDFCPNCGADMKGGAE